MARVTVLTLRPCAWSVTCVHAEAVAAAFNAGLELCFGCDPFLDHGDSANASHYLARALSSGLVSTAQLNKAIARVMLTRFRLGEFDEGPGRPWADVDESLLDSDAHRALAREAAAASTVLAHNKCVADKCALPYKPAASSGDGSSQQPQHTIAVLGPFANCSDAVGDGWAKTNCYLHSYAGMPSKIVSVLDAVREDASLLNVRKSQTLSSFLFFKMSVKICEM